MLNDNSVCENGARWLLHSGIQAPSGGVARYYRSDLRRNAPISTEITGYTASALAFLLDITALPGLSERLRLTAGYLARAWNPVLAVFPFEMEDGQGHLSYFFDNGIVLRGLLAASRIFPEAGWSALVQAGAHGMLRRFGAGAAIEPVMQLPQGSALPHELRWSRLPGCYQLKSALAWRAAALHTGDPALQQAWEATLSAAIAGHEAFLPGSPEPARVMDRLHAYCYFLEALLLAPDSAQRTALLRGGIARVQNLLRAIEPEFVRSDVYAQLLRIRLLAAAVVPLDTVAAAREAAELQLFQAQDDDPALHGGFRFGRNRDGLLPFVNPVSTIFALQALHWWRQWRVAAHLPSADSVI